MSARTLRFLAILGVAGLAFPTVALADGGPAPASAAPAAAPGNRAEADKFFEQGEVLREEGKWIEAAQAYGKAIDADESHWSAHVRYQQAAAALGRTADLVQQYDETVKARPNDPLSKLHRLRLDPPAARATSLAALLKAAQAPWETQVELGRASLAAGDVPGARKALDAAWTQKPDTGELLLLSSEALRRSGDADGARKRLETAAKAVPDLFEVVLALARLDLIEGKNADALKRADAVITMRPSHVAALLLRSEACSRLGKKEDALAALETALRIHPDDPDALLAQADLTAKGATTEGLKKAAELYKKALTAKGVATLRAYYGLGWAQERVPLLPEAGEAYRQAGLIVGTDAAVVNSIGVVLLKQKRFQDAIAQFKKAIDLDKDSPEAYANIGAVADEQGDWNEAIKWYGKVLAMKGQDKNVRCLLLSAFDYEAISNYKKAEDLLERVVAIRPDDSEVHTFYADDLFFQHKWGPATKAYQDAVKLNDKNRFAWRGLGLSLDADGKDQDAVAALEKAKALKADDPLTLYNLGSLYAEKEIHDLQKAIDNYEAYVKAGGSNTDVPAIIEELKKELDAEKKNGK